MSHDYIKTVNRVQIGHFIDHHKHEHRDSQSWIGDNSVWFAQKWGNLHFDKPCFRQEDEIGWYPRYTEIYSEKFNISCEWKLNTVQSVIDEREIFH